MQKPFPSLLLGTCQGRPMQAEDYNVHCACVHCGILGTWLVQGKSGENFSLLPPFCVCERDAVRYQPALWTSWAWAVDLVGVTFRGPLASFSLEQTGTSTLAIRENIDGQTILLTVPWALARPFAPLNSDLWASFSLPGQGKVVEGSSPWAFREGPSHAS